MRAVSNDYPSWTDVCIAAHSPGADSVVQAGLLPLGSEQEGMGHGQHSPDCVLCIALAPAESFEVDVHRPPIPEFHQKWRNLPVAVVTLDVAAPLPARGPPGAVV